MTLASTVNQTPLAQVRDLLLPALRQHFGTGGYPVELDIAIDFVTGSLVVKEHCAATKRDSSFIISKSNITSENYKTTFNKQVSDLVDFLKYGPVAQGAVA